MARVAEGLSHPRHEHDGCGVAFLDWVPYEERHLYVLESDVCVSLHRSGVESEFAFRTRVLDSIWCERPMVLSAGDDLATRVEREGLGRAVPPGDPDRVAAAIEELLDEPDVEARRLRLRRARESLAWSRVVAPLVEFCRAPRFAPDRERSTRCRGSGCGPTPMSSSIRVSLSIRRPT